MIKSVTNGNAKPKPGDHLTPSIGGQQDLKLNLHKTTNEVQIVGSYFSLSSAPS